MSNKKQSSVEWLISQLQRSKNWYRVLNEVSLMSSAKIDIISQAKQMHKEEVCQFVSDYLDDADYGMTAEEYYKEIYGDE